MVSDEVNKEEVNDLQRNARDRARQEACCNMAKKGTEENGTVLAFKI